MGELPVTKPAGVEFVYAMLALRRQDIVPVPRRGDADRRDRSAARLHPQCADREDQDHAGLRKAVQGRGREGQQDGEEAKVDEKDRQRAEDERERGDAAMRKCFAERVKSDPAFAKLTKQAQDFVDYAGARSKAISSPADRAAVSSGSDIAGPITMKYASCRCPGAALPQRPPLPRLTKPSSPSATRSSQNSIRRANPVAPTELSSKDMERARTEWQSVCAASSAR